jgi:surface protein
MSIIGGQNPIVQNGLVYILDFGNERSYVSGSSTVQSLVYSPVTASFVAPLPGAYSGLAAAYSVRKVVPGYTGPAVEIQSGSATLNIGFDSLGNLNTASIVSFAGSGDAFVKTWYDQSGNGRHATPTSVSRQPKIYSGSQGSVIVDSGKPGILFNAADSGLITNLTISKPFSIFTCFTQFGGGGLSRVLQSTTNNSLISAVRSGNTVYVGSDVRSSAYATSGQKVLGSLINNTTSSRYYFQGNDITTTTNNSDWGGFSIGAAGVFVSEQTNATIHEILVYRNNQSTNRLPIELNINNYYNAYPLTSSTPTIPDLSSNLLKPTTPTSLQTNRIFPNFSYNQGNSTLIFTAQTGESTTSIDGGDTSILLTTSSVAYTAGNTSSGRQFTTSGFNHIALRFFSGSVDCFINGVPAGPSTINTIGAVGQKSALTTTITSGSLGNLLVYNRQLTDNEIYAIYLQQARRYGLPEIPKPYTVDSSVYIYTQVAGITGSSTISALNTFVSGLKSTGLWDKMIAIYPFIGTNINASRLNLKDVSLNTTQVNYSGSWSTSLSGSYNNNTGSYGILSNITPTYSHPLINSQSIHLSYLSYDTPVSGGYLMGVEEIPGLPGDIAQPAAAYSVRKVRTAYTGSIMRVRRDFDDAVFDVGFDSSGNLNTGSLITNMTASGITTTLPGDYSGLAVAYSLRRVSSSYTGSVIEVTGDTHIISASIGFDPQGNLDTGSLLQFSGTGSNVAFDSYSGLKAAYSLRKVVPGYVGNAIEVQSGSVSQSIGFDGNGDLDTGSLLSFVGSGNGFVKTWYDQSGNNNHATTPSNTQQPQIVSAGTVLTVGGKPAMLFDGSDDRLTMPGLHGQSTLDQYFVASTSDTVYLYPSPTNGPFGFVATAGATTDTTIYIGYGFPSLYANGTLFTGSTRGDVYNFLTGSKLIIHQGANTNTWNVYGIGDFNGWDYSGYLQELIAFTSSQASNRLYIQNNINSYYGIYGVRPSNPPTTNVYVKSWYDQSGNGIHATQAITSSRPLIISSGSLVTSSFARLSVKFDGVDDYLDTATITVTSQSIFSVQQNITGKSVDVIFGANSANYFTNNIGGNTIINNGFNGDGDGFTGGYTNILSVLSYHRDGTGIISGSAFSNGVSLTGTTNLTTRVGSYADLGGFSPFTFQGFISEFLLYNNSKLSSRGLIEDNINGYYNIFTQSLASNSGYVQTWYDQSGDNRHATQSVAASQPLILSSGSIITQGGKPYLNFNNKLLTTTAPYTSGVRYTSFQAIKQLAGAVLGATTNTGGAFYAVSDTLGSSSFSGFSNVSYYKNGNLISGVLKSSLYNVLLNEDVILTSFMTNTSTANLTIGYPGYSNYNLREKIIYASDQSSSRQPIEYNINSYFNVYTPLPYNTGTNSLSLFSSPTLLAGAANASPTQLTTGGPEGLITVSRTGSGDYTLWKNRVPTKTNFTPSVPQSRSLYLNSANLSNALFSGSQNNVSYASVGAGLTDDDVYTYYELVDDLQTSLNRGVVDPTAFITTWDTRISGTGTVTGTSSIALPLFGTQAITASWGDGTVSLISQSLQNDRIHTYATPGVYTVSITGTGQGFRFNNGGDRAKLLDIGQWGSISGSTTGVFNGCFNLVGTAADSHVLQTTNLGTYFLGAFKFNGYINNWNISNVTSLYAILAGARLFNQPINTWDTSKVTDMSYVFEDAILFNQPIASWDTSNVITMFAMFNNYRGLPIAFNQPIGSWNVSKVQNMSYMFGTATAFNNSGSSDINNWRPISCSNFSNMFSSATAFNQPVGNWTIGTGSQIPATGINMSNMFNNADAFNQNIGAWNVKKLLICLVYSKTTVDLTTQDHQI